MSILIRNILVFTLIVVFYTSCSYSTKTIEAKKGVIDLSNSDLSSELFYLDGEWEFYPNQILTPDDFNKSENTYLYDYVHVPSTKPVGENQNTSLDTGFATYRVVLKLNESGYYAIDYDYIYSAADFWINGKKVHQIGEVANNSEKARGVYTFGYFPFKTEPNSSNKQIELIINVSDYSTKNKFGITKSLTFGKYETIIKSIDNQKKIYFITIGLLLVMTLYYFLVYIFYPKNNSLLAFVFLTLVIAIRSFYTNTIIFEPANFNISIRISFISAIVFVIMMVYFYRNYFEALFSKLFLRIVFLIGVSFIIYYFLVPVYFVDFITPFLYMFFTLVNFYAVYRLYKGVIKKERGALLIFAAQIVLVLSMTNDVLFNSRVVSTGYIMHYTVSIFVLLQATSIAKTFAKTYQDKLLLANELEVQKNTLETVVEERMEQLKRKNIELKKLSIIAENSHNSIVILDKDFNVIWGNKSSEKLYGKKIDSEQKENYFLKYTNDKNVEMFSVSLEKGRSISYESQIINAKKELKWVQTTLSPVIDNDVLSEIIVIKTDITNIKEFQNELLKQNNKITSSLRYAKTIQSSILPLENEIKQNFDYFIYYKPLDIVSGDFYFFQKITHANVPFIISGVADCTGHGVPGAFMSLILHGLFEDIVLQRDIYKPSEILRLLNVEIRKILRQDESQNTDGAAVVLLKITPQFNFYSVEYATANLSFFYFNSETKELKALRGNVNHIGGNIISNVAVFRNFQLRVNAGDIFYMQSDGIIDQPNSDRKRFGKNQYKSILFENLEKNMTEQKEIIVQKFNKWKGNVSQYDDVMIYALKMKPIEQK